MFDDNCSKLRSCPKKIFSLCYHILLMLNLILLITHISGEPMLGNMFSNNLGISQARVARRYLEVAR